MLRVGLTGGIGSGKSTVAARFAELGALVVDSDVLAREVVVAGSEGLAAVVDRFGDEVLTSDGTLDRGRLGAAVFADERARADLERILHPRIGAEAARRMDAALHGQVVVHDVPLLVEKGMGSAYHLVLVVHADADVRVERLVSVRGMTAADARARVAAQADDETRRSAADVWLVNHGDRDDLATAVDALWRERLLPFNDNLLARRRAPRPGRPTLAGPDPTWPDQAARLTARITDRIGRGLGGLAVTLDHIGSTAVPGLRAKDVIDLQLGLPDLAGADDPQLVLALEDAGYPRSWATTEDVPPPAAAPGPWPKRFHGSADPGRTTHLHVRAIGSPGWEYALLFRDWLRADEAERSAYELHKQALAQEHPTTTAYAQAKQPWFDAAYPRARAWAERTGWRPTAG